MKIYLWPARFKSVRRYSMILPGQSQLPLDDRGVGGIVEGEDEVAVVPAREQGRALLVREQPRVRKPME